MNSKILLVGPCPPPDGGTTIPFRLFVDHAIAHRHGDQRFLVLDSNTGDKSARSLLEPATFWRLVSLVLRIVKAAVTSGKIIIFGSQRFITIVGSIVIAVGRPLGKSIYFRINGGAFDRYYESSSPLVRFLIRKVLNCANGLVVETDLVLRNLVPVWGDKVSSVPNCRPTPKQSEIPRDFAKGKICFIYTGYVRQLKGCAELLTAFEKLEKKLRDDEINIEISLDLYGHILNSSDEPLDLKPFEVNRKIRIHGAIRNELLPQIYRDADVFVFPSYWPTEGHSGSIVEAMMQGLPIVATDWRAMREVVTPGQSGLLCKPKSAQDLMDKMYMICTDTGLRKNLSLGALAASRRFDEKIVCASLFELFDLQK